MSASSCAPFPRVRWIAALVAATCLLGSAALAAPAAPLSRIASVPPRPAPSAQALGALAAPNPADLRSRFPAGLTAGSGVIDSGIANPGSSAPEGPLPPWVVVGTGGGGVRGPSQYVAGGPLPYSAVDIARWFLAADRNRDGELSRAEAQRLAFLPLAFEEMDRNFDGVLSRWEFEDGLR